MSRNDKIYSATYSNVPVYEYNVVGNHVMRRRSDDWINATHILKVADFDKPARTRILEREVQKGVHEKVQGGYGKYQGTWVPLHDGRILAERNGVLEKLRPIFDFVPGDRSPPPAPKHATAASTKPRTNRQTNAPKPRAPGKATTNKRAINKVLTDGAAFMHPSQGYDPNDVHMAESETPDNVTVASESQIDDYDASQYTNPSRKRRRVEDTLSQADKEHQLWADELLDYFMLQDHPLDGLQTAPSPPPGANLDRPIDEKGHTALHWAAAMGDLEVVRDLIRRGANSAVAAKNGETPLHRSVIFTNNHDRQNMEKMAACFIRHVGAQDWFGASVFHHIATTTQSKSKYACARYYIDCILNKMAEHYTPGDVERYLNMQDQNGDTAITIAARNGARKCVRSLIGRHAAVDIPNDMGETADELIVQLNHRRHDGRHRLMSSSPFQADGGAVQPLNASINGGAVLDTQSSHTNGSMAFDGYQSEAATTLTSQIMPVLFSKAKNLAGSLDAEIAEKDAELAEAERLATMRRQEIEMLKRQQEELRVREEKVDDDAMAQELDGLERQCEGLLEQEQSNTLADLVSAEDAKQSSSSEDAVMDGTDDPLPVLREKLLLANELSRLASQRQDLVRTVVQNLSVAGVSDRQGEYKRLITGALGVREEDVEGMLPDILAELEDWRGLEAVGA